MLSESQILTIVNHYSKSRGYTKAAATNLIRKTLSDFQEIAALAETHCNLCLQLATIPPEALDPPSIDEVAFEDAPTEELTTDMLTEAVANTPDPPAEKPKKARKSKAKTSTEPTPETTPDA